MFKYSFLHPAQIVKWFQQGRIQTEGRQIEASRKTKFNVEIYLLHRVGKQASK
jgi:hypothetical protein